MEEIKATELRLGNTLQLQGKPIKVNLSTLERLLFSDMEKYSMFREQYKPLELTEGILVDYGFEPIPDKKYPDIINFTKEYNDFTYSINHRNTEPKFSFWIFDNPIAYFNHVHEMQNLYYSLTGVELVYNPKNHGYEDIK